MQHHPDLKHTETQSPSHSLSIIHTSLVHHRSCASALQTHPEHRYHVSNQLQSSRASYNITLTWNTQKHTHLHTLCRSVTYLSTSDPIFHLCHVPWSALSYRVVWLNLNHLQMTMTMTHRDAWSCWLWTLLGVHKHCNNQNKALARLLLQPPNRTE
jgi:hypothetical protein